MTVEQLKEILGEDDEKVQQVLGAWEEEVQGLVSTKDKLRAELKELKRSTKSGDDDVSQLKARLEEYEAAEARRQDELDREAKNFDAILQREREKLNKQMEEVSEANKRLVEQRNGILVENSLSRNFASVGVDDRYRPDLTDAFRSRTFVRDDGEHGPQIVVRDGDIELPVDEYFGEWAGSERAKAYITDRSRGGGASGGTGSGSANVYRRSDLRDAKKRQEFMERRKRGEEVTIQED